MFASTGSLLGLAAALSACQANPDSLKQRYIESGDRYLEQRSLQEAAIEYRNAVQVDPRFVDARLRLASTYDALGQTADALSEYVRAADLRPDDDALQLKTATLLVGAGRYDDALAGLDRLLERHPEHVQAHVLRGEALAALQDLDGALAAMETALHLDPTRGETLAQLGLLHETRGDAASAERVLKQAIAVAPDLVSARLALANLNWSAGRLLEAEHELVGALDVAPANEEATRAMTALLFATGRPDLAEQYLRRSADASGTAEAVRALVEFYLSRSRPADALKVLRALPAGHAAAESSHDLLAQAYAAAGDWTAATAVVENMLGSDPRNVDTLLLHGQLLLGQGQPDQALARVRAALEVDPASVSARFWLGRLLADHGDTVAAESAFREVLRLNPSSAAAHVELSKLYLAAGSPAAALRAANDAVRADPTNLDVRVALVRSQLANGDATTASRLVQRLLLEHPGVAAVHSEHGVLLAMGNEPSLARRAFFRALEIDPFSLAALAGLVELDVQAKDPGAATRRVEQRLASGPVTTPALLLAARTYRSVGDIASAKESVLRAIAADASSLAPHKMLAELYLSERRFNEALREFEALAARQANPASALTRSGLILQAQGLDDLAEAHYVRAVAADPGAAVAANNLAWMYAQDRKRPDEALRLARAAVDARPDQAEVLDTLGWVHYQRDEPEMALRPLSRCTEKAPLNATCWYHLGLALVKTGDMPQGRTALRRALALDGKAPWARDALVALAGQASR